MSATSVQIERMKELQAILYEAADAYYNRDTEIMSNYEYDALYDELVNLETETGEILPNSITQGTGVEAQSALPKVQHDSPMLSLAKTKSRDEIASWLGEHKGCLSWKLDGSTVVLTYENGELVQAVTRGNGIIGEDITTQAKKFSYVPLNIEFEGKLVVRGEALMTYSEFERVNASQPVEQKYKNPRNLASGTMRALDTSVLDTRTVEFHPFTLVSAEGTEENSYSAQLDWLGELGFEPVEHTVVDANTVRQAIDNMESQIDTQDIPSDGLVLFYDDVQYGLSLGSTGHAPRNGIAFKWADETVLSELENIVWQTSRTGRINPVAVFKPVELEGTTVSRATLNNLSFIQDTLGTPFVGQKIRVYKANKIIPTVMTEEIGNGSQKENIHIPHICPACEGDATVVNEHGSEFLMCLNEECPARQESALVHFASRDAMDMNGLSAKTIRKLSDAGIIASFADIITLPSRRSELISEEINDEGAITTVYLVDGMKERSVDNLLNSIEQAKNTTASRFLYSLGIREIGRSASNDICNAYANDVSAIIDDCVSDNLAKISSIQGIGDIMVSELATYMRKNEKMVRDLLSLVSIADIGVESNMHDNDFISGKTFVVTGDVHIFSKRDELKEFVISNGGKVSGSVSGKTDFLITNTPDSGTSKNKKAQELGIPIITEDEFCERAGYNV